ESQNPMEKIVEAQQNGLVYLEGLDIPTSVKLMLAENALKVNGEGFGLVEENDCGKIKEEWNRLRAESEKLNCGELQKKLDEANAMKKNFGESLAQAQTNLDAADKEAQKWKDYLEKFLKDSGLENEDVKLDPPPGADAWSYANFNRHGIQMWINGDKGAERVIGHFDKWKKEIDGYRAEVEKAQGKKDSVQGVVDGITKDIESITLEISSLEAQLSDCLGKKAELENQLQNLESLYKNCLEKIKAQAGLSKKSRETGAADSWVQLDNIHTGEKISHFPELDKEIAGLEKAVGETDPECTELKNLQDAAKAALEKAKAKREEAAAKFRESMGLYNSGSLVESERFLGEANSLLAEAKALAVDAQKKTQEAINAKVNCKVNLEAKKNGAEAEAAEWKEWIKTLRERSKVEGKPFEMNEKGAKVRLDIELKELVPKALTEEGCGCPFKLLSAAKANTFNIYVDAIRGIGISAIKAPIDALTPEGLLGKAAQKIASWALGYLGADSFGDFLKDAIIDELVGALLPETDIPIIDAPVSSGTSSAVSASIDDWLAGSGIQIWAVEGGQTNFHSANCGDFECTNLKIVIIYNPKTRHMLTLIKGDCCPGVLMISTKFDENGVSDDSETKYFP
ncbi:MAG: hypothetical protein Q7K34_00690, partial [archaeon]|nr:hypothetical protein [archaeon]